MNTVWNSHYKNKVIAVTGKEIIRGKIILDKDTREHILFVVGKQLALKMKVTRPSEMLVFYHIGIRHNSEELL
jgi:hypothetical protein